jgi:predicted RNA binding protein YcfA (HicA-like mRNA interferase family)
MPKPIKLKTIIQVLERRGFFFVSQKGSHSKFRSKGLPKKTVIVKMTNKEVPQGTFRSIVSMSGLRENDFRQK